MSNYTNTVSPQDIMYHVGTGATAGFIGTLFSHPFDTCKVYLQLGLPLDITKRTYFQNIRWGYAGMAASITGYTLEKTIIFGSYSNISNIFNLDSENSFHTFCAGLTSGLLASPTITIFEKIKMDRQLEKKRILIMEQITYYKKMEDLKRIKNLEKTMKDLNEDLHNKNIEKSKYGLKEKEYNLKYLCRGLKYTAGREGLGFAIYFNIYNWMTNKFNQNNNNKFSPLKSGSIGALSAFIAWIPIYPIDRMKTFSQCDNSNSLIEFKKTYKNTLGIINKIKFLYKGYHYAMLRAIPFHATCFIIFDYSKYYKNNL